MFSLNRRNDSERKEVNYVVQPFINVEERSKEWEYHKSRFEVLPKVFVLNHAQAHENTCHAAAPSADRFLRHSQFEILNVDAYRRSKNPKARWISPHEYRCYLMSMEYTTLLQANTATCIVVVKLRGVFVRTRDICGQTWLLVR
jgi:hypothetical protein